MTETAFVREECREWNLIIRCIRCTRRYLYVAGWRERGEREQETKGKGEEEGLQGSNQGLKQQHHTRILSLPVLFLSQRKEEAQPREKL